MRESEFIQTLHFNTNGNEKKGAGATVVNQSVPIVLPCTAEDKARIESTAAIALVHAGKTLAILQAPEVYDGIKEERCSRTFGLSHKVTFFPRKLFRSGIRIILIPTLLHRSLWHACSPPLAHVT
jgi:hypothetical protein